MQNSLFNFKNKICLITGAGSYNGIGFATANLMGNLGGTVLIVATTDRIIQRADELKSKGIDAEGFICDLMNRDEVNNLINIIINKYEKIDVLVNNAGMTQVGDLEDFSLISEMTYDSWDLSINRNLNITFNVTKEILPYMINGKYGRIVNISSVTGPVVSNPGEAAYSAAKSGIVGLSKALAIEVGIHNITVNNILPGWIASESQTKEEKEGGLNTPLKRGGEPAEVANAIAFLASKEASYVTGECLIVDGGNTIQEYKGDSALYY